MALEEQIKDQLASHVAISGWQLEVGQMPTRPDRVTMISVYSGQPPNPKWLIDYPLMQLLTRGQMGGYIAARDESRAIRDILLGCDSRDVLGDRWVSVTMLSDIGFIGNDENDRPMFSANFRFIVEPAASAETNREPL